MPSKDKTRARKIPSQERARASVDAILTATAELLRTKGFRRTTTNLIAERAGVNVALVYRYFAGKEAIVGALIDRFAADTLERARLAMLEHARAPFDVAVRALLAVLVDTPDDPALHRELYEHVSVAGRRQFLRATGDAIAALFEEFLAARKSELRRGMDQGATLFVLRYALEAAVHAAAFYRPPELEQDRVMEAMTALVTDALLGPGSAREP